MASFSRASASYGYRRRFVQAVFAAILLCAAPAWARTLKIVALGDSLTAGYGLPQSQGFPEALGRALKAKGWDVEVINAGVSGETAEDGLARYEWSVPEGTDALIVELGANDMLRGLPPQRAKDALAQILTRASQAHVATLLAGMRAAPNLGEDYRKSFDAIYPELSEKFGVALYPFFLDGVAGDPKLNQKDALHPTKEGVDKIVTAILPSVEALLTKIK